MELPGVLHKDTEQIELELHQIVDSRPMPFYRMMAYHLGWIDEQGNPAVGSTGRRIRPALCLLACEAAGGDREKALPAAAAVELVHNFSLIHGDIQDGTTQRHHRASVWWAWGPAQAINAGDGMHALARLALFRLKERGLSDERVFQAIKVLDKASLKLCEGQYLDISYQERLDVGVNAYLSMVEGKTGALMEAAMRLGALVANENQVVANALGLCGRKLGMAYQIRNDLQALWGDTGAGSPPSSDILNKKKTLPVVYALEKAGAREKRQLGEIYFKRVLEPPDISHVVAILDRLGVKEYCQEQIRGLLVEALRALEESGLTQDRTQGIREAAEFLVHL